MPYISDVTIRLRFQTCKIIDTLIEQGKAENQKKALLLIIKKAKNLSGFSSSDIERVYNCYLHFRNTHYKEFCGESD